MIVLILALAACQSSDVSRTLGARCDLNSDCAQICLMPSTDWPGGFCTTTCDSDASCDGNAHCVDDTLTTGMCAFACTTDADCAFLGQYTCQARDRHNGGNKVMVCRGG